MKKTQKLQGKLKIRRETLKQLNLIRGGYFKTFTCKVCQMQ